MWQCLENANLREMGDLYIPGGGLDETSLRVGLQVARNISTVHDFPAGEQQFHVDFVSAVDWWQTQLMVRRVRRLFHYASFAKIVSQDDI